MKEKKHKKIRDYLYEGREYPLELRLLQFFVLSQMCWAFVNWILSMLNHLPKMMTNMYMGSFFFLVLYWFIAYHRRREKLFIEIYYVIYLITLPIIWYCVGGGVVASANVLFVCELVVFAMCTKGKKQIAYIALSLLTSTGIQAMQQVVPGFSPIDITGREIALASRNIGITTSLVIVATLLKQKKEYAKERDAAIESEKALERSNEMQKNFLANMSHEIRSPLGIVMGFNNLIKDSNDLEQIHTYSADISQAGSTLLAVINDILDYSKIESGKLDIIEVDYSPKQLISDINKDIGLKCAEKGLTLKINYDESIPAALFGDNIRIKQCLINILSNAVKYTDKGTVTFDIKSLGVSDTGKNLLEFVVTDTGRGIKKEAIPYLFNAFQRLDEGANRGIEGTGLGLAITKNLLDEMSGSIEVESELGAGSTFRIKLEQANGEIKDSIPKDVIADNLNGVKALVVDDTKLNLVLVNKLLDKHGVIVKTIDNGKECLADTQINKYDIILLDHMMPEMDGIEVFKKLRESEGPNKDTPVIMLTANAMAGAALEYMNMGFDGYLSKPIVTKDLYETVAKYTK